MDQQAPKPGVEFEITPRGRSAKPQVTARFADGSALTDCFDAASQAKREEFRDKVVARWPGLTAEEVDRALEDLVGTDSGEQQDEGRKSQATQLVELVEEDEDVELFHTPGGHDSEGYARVTVDQHRETWSLNSKAFKRWLARRFFLSRGKAPGSQALSDATNVLAGRAVHEGEEHDVHVRVAEHGGAIWLDLADERWRAVAITASGWRVVDGDQVPVRFVRKRGMLPLPIPVHGGRLDDLRAVVNVPDEDQWILVKAWMVAALRPGRPFPVLNINGEQGSAKSTLCKMVRALVDPSRAAVRRPPKDERDLMIAASNSWAVVYDNISGLSASLSDALCCIATGGAFGARELYTDADEKLIEAIRPVIVNGIDDAVTRPDLLDRCINLHLPTIPEELRRDEDELWTEFEPLRPGILGALLDAVATALANYPTTRLARRPRMAAFARWAVAAEPALGCEPARSCGPTWATATTPSPWRSKRPRSARPCWT
jgi:hypothetical protein